VAATRAELAAIVGKRGDGLVRSESIDELPPQAFAALLAIDLSAEPGEVGARVGARARADIARVLREHFPGRKFVAPHVYHLHRALVTGRARGPG
jgi:hypothetical protein